MITFFYLLINKYSVLYIDGYFFNIIHDGKGDDALNDRKKWIWNILLLLVITSLTLFALLHGEDPRQLFHLLEYANSWYWLAAVAMIPPFVACESLILYLLLKRVGEKPIAGHCLIYSFIGFFFSCITPAAGGGQPVQIYYMHKDRLNPGTTTPILVIVTICYKLVLVIAGIILFIFRPPVLSIINDTAISWACIGWIANVIAIFFFLSVILFPKMIEKICLFLLGKLRHLPIKEKRLDSLQNKLIRSISSYHSVTSCMKNSGSLIIVVTIISIIQRTFLFSVTWLVLKSFYCNIPWLEIVLVQSMVSLGTDLIPLPGGSGAHETMFLLLFNEICGETLALPILMASRGISYYGQIILCGLVFFLFSRRLNRRKK